MSNHTVQNLHQNIVKHQLAALITLLSVHLKVRYLVTSFGPCIAECNKKEKPIAMPVEKLHWIELILKLFLLSKLLN